MRVRKLRLPSADLFLYISLLPIKGVCTFVFVIDNSVWLTVACMYDYLLALNSQKITQQCPQSRLRNSSERANTYITTPWLGDLKDIKCLLIASLKNVCKECMLTIRIIVCFRKLSPMNIYRCWIVYIFFLFQFAVSLGNLIF